MALQVVRALEKPDQDPLRSEREALIISVRKAVLAAHPHLASKTNLRPGHHFTTLWREAETKLLEQLSPTVQKGIRANQGKALKDAAGHHFATIFPEDHEAVVRHAARGMFSKVVPAYIEIPSIVNVGGPRRFQRVAFKRCRGTNETAQFCFGREQDMARILLPLFDQENPPASLSRPIAIAEDSICYEWCGDEAGNSLNILQARAGNKLSPGEFLRCIADIADGLAWLHKKSIKYLDLKPGHIIIGPQKSAKLVDFGGARLYHEIADENTVFNSAYYDWATIIRQELRRNALDVADKHALGVLLQTFLQEYGSAEIVADEKGIRRLTLTRTYLALILKVSTQLRESFLHPYPSYETDPNIRDPDYHSLAHLGNTLRKLAQALDHIETQIELHKGGLLERGLARKDPRSE